MIWPFKRKPAPPPPPRDCRNWNEDWKVGDIAECIVDGVSIQWDDCVQPWDRPALGQRLTVSGFVEGVGNNNRGIWYFLQFEGWGTALPTQGFRKVRPVSVQKSEVVERILKAKPGKDRVREGAQ